MSVLNNTHGDIHNRHSQPGAEQLPLTPEGMRAAAKMRHEGVVYASLTAYQRIRSELAAKHNLVSHEVLSGLANDQARQKLQAKGITKEAESAPVERQQVSIGPSPVASNLAPAMTTLNPNVKSMSESKAEETPEGTLDADKIRAGLGRFYA